MGIKHLNGEDLVRLDRDGYGVCGQGQVRTFDLLHEVGLDCVLSARGYVQFDLRRSAGPLVHTEYDGVGVFGFFHRRKGDVLVLDRCERVRRWKRARVRHDLRGDERRVEFVAPANGFRLLPGAGVRVKRVGEVLMALVGVGVRPGGRTQERDAERVADGVVAVLRVVEDGEAGGGVAEVGPAECGDFELGFLERVVAGSGALDGAVRDFVGGFGTGVGEREGGFEEDVLFVPVDVVGDADGVGPGVKRDVLDEMRGLPCPLDADGLAEWAVFDELDGVDLVDDCGCKSRVPGSMFQASYCLGLSGRPGVGCRKSWR